MQYWSWSSWIRRISPVRACLTVALLIAGAPQPAQAGVPDWLRRAAGSPLPDYPDETVAVMLFNEQSTAVNSRGEMKTRYRRAYKILRPEGSRYGIVAVYFDNDTSLTYLKAWSLPAGEKAYEVKEKEAVVTSPFFGELFTDTRLKWLQIPAAHPGNVVGYEYEQIGRPLLLQDIWGIAQPIPVRQASYTLKLPKGWDYDAYWVHCPEQKSQPSRGNAWTWRLTDIPAVEPEPAMPDWQAVAGRLVVGICTTDGELSGSSHGSWQDVGRWYGRLAHPRRQGSAEITRKVEDLTAALPALLDRIKAVAAFVQGEVRYVAIEIGVGGYQPHPARAVLANRYGDCKDKAALLAAMLAELGIESHFVLVHSRRGVVEPDAPTLRSFNHAILALHVPAEIPTGDLYAMCKEGQLGRLLFFDPTDTVTPLGYLPASLQAGQGLLVTDKGGELLELPLMPPIVNRLLRQGKFILSGDGNLSGSVQEIRWGTPATNLRRALQAVATGERIKVLERYLADDLGGFVLQNLGVANVDEHDQNLVVNYRFVAEQYAKKAGNLLLVRPRVIGEMALNLLDEKPRRYPVEFTNTTSVSDTLEIVLPSGYEVNELPPPVTVSNDYAEYKSAVEAEDLLLRYKRTFTLKQILVPTSHLEEVKQFFRRVSTDERIQVVLQRVGT